ncbi:hypothetical protein HY949_00295 [Candidatus Gottesmanbacteria bacterium]|nr:hypothetical protein [Candidatus Gottesmanbacteria bacterium]
MRRLFWIILTVFVFMFAADAYAVSPFEKCNADKTEINTAIGCISAGGTGGIIGQIFKFGTGIAGGIAFLLILFGGFQILTSTGNPEKLNEGKELIASAITGLLMILFSVFLLKFIGVDLLCIPGFGSC